MREVADEARGRKTEGSVSGYFDTHCRTHTGTYTNQFSGTFTGQLSPD